MVEAGTAVIHLENHPPCMCDCRTKKNRSDLDPAAKTARAADKAGFVIDFGRETPADAARLLNGFADAP